MPLITSTTTGRVVRVALALVALSAVISVRAAEQPTPTGEAALAREVEGRFDVVILRDGVALAARQADRRVEISRGVVMTDGQALSGDDIRRRFGADADLVLRLSYLDNATLQRLFRPVAPPTPAAAPVPAPPPAPGPPPPAPAPPAVFDRPSPADAAPIFHRTGARISLAKQVVVRQDEEVTDGVFSAGGSVRIDGRVRDNVVVIGGDLELTPTAEVRGDITVMGGELTIAEGARHVGAVHHAARGAWPRWSWPSFGWSRFEPTGAARWLPLAGTTARVLLLAIATVIMVLLARGRLARIGAVTMASPVKAGLVGLTAQLLFVPAIVILVIVLAVTIVGLPFIAVLVPLAVLIMLGAMLLGFVGLAQRLGQAAGRVLGWTGEPMLPAALAGMAMIVLPTVLARLVGVGPDAVRGVAVALLVVGSVVEYVAWTIGLGAALLTGLGRWAVVPPPVPPPFPGDPMTDAPSAI